MADAKRLKKVTLTFRGFANDPQAVVTAMGRCASATGMAGFPLRPGIETLLKRSFAQFALPLHASTRLFEVIPQLVEHLGGLEAIKTTRDAIRPEYLEVDIRWPVVGSQEQENGFFPPEVLATLHELECSISFSFN